MQYWVIKQHVLRDIQDIETGKKRSIDRYPRKSDDIAQYCVLSSYWFRAINAKTQTEASVLGQKQGRTARYPDIGSGYSWRI